MRALGRVWSLDGTKDQKALGNEALTRIESNCCYLIQNTTRPKPGDAEECGNTRSSQLQMNLNVEKWS